MSLIPDLEPFPRSLRAAMATHEMVEEALNSRRKVQERTPTPRVVRATVECQHTDPDSGRPCNFGGYADVAVFDDTREVLWWCPFRHENSERYSDFGHAR